MSDHLRQVAIEAAARALIEATAATSADDLAECARLAEVALDAADKALREVTEAVMGGPSGA